MAQTFGKATCRKRRAKTTRSISQRAVMWGKRSWNVSAHAEPCVAFSLALSQPKGSSDPPRSLSLIAKRRSEERRVGKECSAGGGKSHYKKRKERTSQGLETLRDFQTGVGG